MIKATASYFLKGKSTQAYLLLISLYLLFFCAVYSLLYYFNQVSFLPGEHSLVRADAVFYKSIKEQGYIYSENKTCNSGFFPLFAYLWKITQTGALGISILNMILYIAGLLLLCKVVKPDASLLLIFMSLPFMFYLFAPLSESLFFLLCSVILYGIDQNKKVLIFTGILLATLTRPSFTFFIPAFIGVVLLLNKNSDLLKKEIWMEKLKLFLLPSILGLLIVCSIQLLQTGHFFGFFEIQSSAWGRSFRFPGFPLSRDSSKLVLWLSWLNCLFGFLILVITVRFFIYRILKGSLIEKLSEIELFSIIFLVMSFLSILFTNPKWYWYGDYNGTYLNGINRYLQPNPFMLVCLVYLFKTKLKTVWSILFMILICHIIWFGLDPDYYKYLYRYKGVVVVSSIISIYALFQIWRWKPLLLLIILVSTVVQCLMFNYFMNWVFVD